jgi:hypothetical protein
VTAASVEPVGTTDHRSAPHPLLTAAFERLDGRGVAWCLLRAADELAAPEGDVDLLVARPAIRVVGDVLGELGFVAVHGPGRGSHQAFVVLDEDDGTWLKLDVVTRIDLGPWQQYRTSLAPRLLARRRREGMVSKLAPDDGFWMLWLHCLLDKDAVSVRHASALTELATEAGVEGPAATFLARLLPPGWDLHRLRRITQEGRWEETAPLVAALRVACERRRPLHSRVTAFRNRWARRLGRHGVRLGRHGVRLGRHGVRVGRHGELTGRGLTIAVLAPDGAGKSTLVGRLRQDLPLPVRQLYMGLFSREQPVPAVPVPGFGSLVRLLRQWRGYLTSRRFRRGGAVVLCDRYCYDALVPGTGPDTWVRRRRRWLLGHACPPPDLTVVLDAPGTVLHQRKPEHEPSDLERRRQGYLALAHRFGWRVIDASRPAEQVQRELSQLIWRAYRDGARAA